MRRAEVQRTTLETMINVEFTLDGNGEFSGTSGLGFFDHMLTLFCKFGGFNLNLSCQGDLDVDDHHTVEDIGLVLGEAFSKALGDKKGIARFASGFYPMDEALMLIAVDISGRPYLAFEADFPPVLAGKFNYQMIEEFFRAFVQKAGITLHVREISGKNLHHKAEAIFKGLGRTLKVAVSVQGDELPSTKGVI